MTRGTQVIQATPIDGYDELEVELLAAFRRALEALADGAPVLVVVRDADLLGHGAAVDAAYANALVGLVRALATEGRRDGWCINALAATDEVGPEDRSTWVERLADPCGASGVLVRLGELQLGRVPL